MNYLKAGLRVKLGFANPYEIKPAYKIFQNAANNQTQAKLSGKHRLNYDSYILSFQLPQQNKCLGIMNGEYVNLKLNGDKKAYVPISPIDQPETVDFLVRDMRAKNPNSFTGKLLDLEMNGRVQITGPESSFVYKGNGKIDYAEDTKNLQKKTSKRFKNIGIITHASGISTTFSMIESIAMNYDNKTGISLLWLGDKEEDFVFINQLAGLADQGKINLNLMLTQYEKGWLGPSGKVTKQHLQDFLPPPPPPGQEDETFIIMSAFSGEASKIKDLIPEMGYKNTLYA